MRCIKVDLPRDIKQLKIIPISDWHIGAKKTDLKMMQKVIKQILEEENTYTFINGDLIDNTLKDSIGDSYENELNPREQLNTLEEMLRPIKHKILSACSGNHENRTKKLTDIDLTYELMHRLGLDNIYDPIGCLLFIRFGEQSRGLKETNGSGKQRKMCYTIYHTHGTGGGRTVGAKANRLHLLGEVINADMCTISHTHMQIAFKEVSQEVDYRNSCVTEKEIAFLNTGSALKYGGYGEAASFKPLSTEHPYALFDGTKRNIKLII